MDFLQTMLDRNADFAASRFAPGLRMLPSAGTIIVGCVDPRVDPVPILGLEQGETAVIRNIGGRVSATLVETLALLRVVAKAAGREDGVRNLVLLHHSDCGIVGCYRHAPDMLAHHLGVAPADLDALAVADPHKAVAHDIATLKADARLPDAMVVTGLVNDVATGRVEVVVPPAALRPAAD